MLDQDRVSELYSRVQIPHSFERMWNQLLTEADRQTLGGDLDQAHQHFGTTSAWMLVRGVANRFVALVQVGFELEFLTQQIAQHLLRALAEPEGKPVTKSEVTPRWNRDLGTLSLAGEMLRKVKRFKIRSNVERILDAFEDHGWPLSIANPLEDSKDHVKIQQAVKQLNEKLLNIRFLVTAGGTRVIWASADTKSQRSHSDLK